ncbi:MAG: 3-deoxy-D-manno-octulosonic acid transferase [Bacteroidetes bacterium]|nr:3-deoxy-D-manno-octulosonic acid transferase [Bacteroidota bacterium]
MQVLIYNLLLFFYRLGILLASPFNAKAKLWIDGRKNWRSKLSNFQWGKEKRIWIHCASLGEFEQARPVIEKLKSQELKPQIILTFFSPSGYEIRKNYKQADVVMYLPHDTKASAKVFLDLVKPDEALFVKYEFWFHYLNELSKKNIPTILFSSVFRNEQVFFKWYGGFFRTMLTKFSKVFVQNEKSKLLLQSIAIESELSFDTRFDRVYEIAQNRKYFPLVEKFKGNSKILIAGSTWPRDEQLLLQLINENTLSGFKFIIVPHDINLKKIIALQKKMKVESVLFSELNNENALTAQILLVNSIGSLSSLYASAEIAYLGGGFNAGIHNVLEAVVYNIPVLFGPNYKKSEEAKELVALGEAYTVSSFTELNAAIQTASSKTNLLGKKYVEERIGGTEKIVAYLSNKF